MPCEPSTKHWWPKGSSVKFAILAAVALGVFMLFATNKNTPFMRWGIVVALTGVVLTLTSTIFTVRGVAFGMILAVAGLAVYYYGRFARKERLFVSRR